MKLRHLTAAVLAAAALACGDSAAPDRSDRYDWVFVDGADSLTFHWLPSELPVRVWVQDSASLSADVTRGLGLWQSTLGEGTFRAVVVNDSATADVIVRIQSIFTAPPPIPPGNPDQFCQGSTLVDTVGSPFQLSIPIHISIQTLGVPSSDSVQACLRRVAAHELGHSLGLFQHSPNNRDLMFTTPFVDAPSDRDANTVITLYAADRNMLPTHRPAVH